MTDCTSTLRRFAGAEVDPALSVGLRADHPALSEARTIFPKSVVSPKDSERLLVSGHNNPKLGAVVQKGPWAGMPIYHLTLEERATCPTTCKVWAECYGNAMPYARRHSARGDDSIELILRLTSEVEALQRAHPDGFVIRLHTLGDFFSVVYVNVWATFLNNFPALRCFGYTAHAPDSRIGEQIKALTDKRWDRFAIRFSGFGMGQSTFVYEADPDVPDVVMCPAQTKGTECCATCGLCWSPSAKELEIGFLKHGMKRWSPNGMDHEDVTYRPIPDISIGKLLGEPGEIVTKIPEIKMLPVDRLCIDTRYQRVITGAGRSNIRQIVENFDWMHFQPILVSPVELDGEQFYAVVDGQHRALAAYNHPEVNEVPAAIVDLTPEKQAAVFAAINSQVVKVNSLEIFWALYASGDTASEQIMECVNDADLWISRVRPMGPQTDKMLGAVWSPTMIRKVIDRSGFGYASLALSLLHGWEPSNPNVLNGYMVPAAARYLRHRRATGVDDFIESLKVAWSYADAKSRVAEIGIRDRRPDETIFEEDILHPILDEVENAAA